MIVNKMEEKLVRVKGGKIVLNTTVRMILLSIINFFYSEKHKIQEIPLFINLKLNRATGY